MSLLETDPLLVNTRAARMLSGLSGARVYLATHDGRAWFVRKAAASPEGSERLRTQSQKQRAWRENVPGPFQTPQILDEGEVDGRYYFDMEAVLGVDGVTHLRSSDYRAVTRFADVLCEHLAAASRSPAICEAASGDLFSALFDRVCRAQRSAAQIDPRDLNSVLLGLERIRTTGPLAATLCHGDLTLENIVVDAEGRAWVLDLLDAPFEHYWHDLAKLHQDVEGAWYRRNHPPIARCVTEFIGRRLMTKAAELDPRYPAFHPVLTACTFIRILPYAASDDDRRFVAERIHHYAELIRRTSP